MPFLISQQNHQQNYLIFIISYQFSHNLLQKINKLDRSYTSFPLTMAKPMSKYAFDVDDSSASMVEMTQAEIGAFKQRQSKCKSKGRSTEKSQSKKKGKKKSKKSSSDEEVAKPKRERRKSEPFKRLTPEQRFSKQIKESELVKYGNAKFVKGGTKSPVQGYSSKAKETLRTGVTWWICNGEYSDENWSNIFCDMYEIETRDLRINNNNYPGIIRQIHHVRFDNLEILNLYENNICSVELLARMRIPQIKDLSLRNNKITTLRSMSKMSLKNLVNFSIADNYILRMDKFYCINTQSLEEMFIEWYLQVERRKGSTVMAEDISWMAKLKKNPKPTKVSAYMETIVIQSRNRIPQRQVDEALSNKYRKPHLFKRKMA